MAKKVEYRPRLLETYNKTIIPALMKKFGYKNVMEVPRLTKINLSSGVGDAKDDPNSLKKTQEEFQAITGQRPVVTYAKKAISNFKIRKGDPVGCRVTLRRYRMYEFLDRLISTAFPRVRDFSGLPDSAFDGRGNYSMGIREQIIFPEVDYDRVDKIRGMNITISTNAATDAEAYELLSLFGFPFKRRAEKVNSTGEKE